MVKQAEDQKKREAQEKINKSTANVIGQIDYSQA